MLTVVTPSGRGGRCTITTGIPSAAAASSFGRVMSPPLFFVTRRVDAVLGEQGQFVVVVVRAAGQHQLVVARQGLRIRRGHGADQEPGVEIREGRDARSARREEDPREVSPSATTFAASMSELTRIASPEGHAGRASTRCGIPRSPHTSAAWAVIVAAYGWVASTTAATSDSTSHRRIPSTAAEAADAYLADRQRGIGHPACQ